MSVCRLIAADIPLPEWAPSQEYPLEINVDEGTIYDGGADDNFFLHSFRYALILMTSPVQDKRNRSTAHPRLFCNVFHFKKILS